MNRNKFKELVSLLEKLRAEVSALLYAGVEPSLICKISGISSQAVEELIRQIRVKEASLFSMDLTLPGTPKEIILRKHCPRFKSKPLTITNDDTYLTYKDTVKLISGGSYQSDDVFLLYCQVGGLVYPFKKLPNFSTEGKIDRYIRQVKSAMPSKNRGLFRKVNFNYAPLVSKGERQMYRVQDLNIEGNYSNHLSVATRVEKLNMMSAVHGVQVLANECKLSVELVLYLLNKRKVDTLDELLGRDFYRPNVELAKHQDLYENLYNFVRPQSIAINNDYFIIYHRTKDRFFKRHHYKEVIHLNIPFDLMWYLMGGTERALAEKYYLCTEEKEQVTWVAPFTINMFDYDIERVAKYVSDETKDNFVLELNNLAVQVRFNLSHLKIGRELLNLIQDRDTAVGGIYFRLYSYCLDRGISLNAVSFYIAPIYTLRSFVSLRLDLTNL